MNTTDTKITKAADWDEDFPVFDVTVDGVTIGTVFRGWWRNGGTGWGNSARGTSIRIAGSRRDAVADLVAR